MLLTACVAPSLVRCNSGPWKRSQWDTRLCRPPACGSLSGQLHRHFQWRKEQAHRNDNIKVGFFFSPLPFSLIWQMVVKQLSAEWPFLSLCLEAYFGMGNVLQTQQAQLILQFSFEKKLAFRGRDVGHYLTAHLVLTAQRQCSWAFWQAAQGTPASPWRRRPALVMRICTQGKERRGTVLGDG